MNGPNLLNLLDWTTWVNGLLAGVRYVSERRIVAHGQAKSLPATGLQIIDAGLALGGCLVGGFQSFQEVVGRLTTIRATGILLGFQITGTVNHQATNIFWQYSVEAFLKGKIAK